MKKHERPLSPFMLGSGYKLQHTSVMSFLHRATGIASVFVIVLIAAWFFFLAFNPAAANILRNIIVNPFFFIIFVIPGVTATIYHFCNGIRHLFWDAGIGITKEDAKQSVLYVQIATAVITIAVLVYSLTPEFA